MDSVIKACVVYFVLWAIIRISGRRTLGEMTAFDLILFLIIGGSTQRAITGEDYSLTNALILVATFVGIEVALSLIELKSPLLRKVLNSAPTLLVENGTPMLYRMRRARVTRTIFSKRRAGFTVSNAWIRLNLRSWNRRARSRSCLTHDRR